MPAAAYGLGLAVCGVAAAWAVHRAVPAVPLLTAAVVLGIGAAHLPGTRGLVRGRGRAGLSLAGKRLMRLGIVLLGLKLSLDDVLGLGWATVAMVFCVVAATFGGTWWLGRRMGLRGDQPLLIATGYSICGASAIGAVSEVSDSDERDVATSVALVTLCGTLAIAVLPLLQQPLGLGDAQFGRWVGASVHDVGQVVAAAQTAGPAALKEAVLVKLMRVALLAPLVAALAVSVRTRAGARRTTTAGTRRPPLVPLFVAGFLCMVALRSTGLPSATALDAAATGQELLLAAALFGLGSAVHLPSLTRTGARVAALGLCAWGVIAGVSYAGVLLTT
nr:putative sulfate exporter family transporter [Streptomyces botrytidirepellens]